MKTKKAPANVSAVVKAVLALHEMSLNFRVELSPEDALQWAGAFQTYNRIGNLSRLIEAINGRVPPMDFGGENANNGRTHHTFKVGNEGSLVIYLSLVHAYLKRDEIPALLSDIETSARSAGADEYHAKDTFGSTDIRMWWD